MSETERLVLVTGARGHMAAQIIPGLEGSYRLRLTDLHGDDEVLAADLGTTERSELMPLFEDVDTVVHLGYKHSAPGANYDAAVPHVEKFEVEFLNIRMVQNVLRCALDAGVRRVVVASSNHAADWYENNLIQKGLKDVVTPEELPLADNFYGWSKASYEHLGFLYACGSLGRQLEVVMVRIGAPRELEADTYSASEPPAPQPGPNFPTGLARYKRDLGAWISEDDVRQLFARCVDAPDIRNEHGLPWQVVYGISDNTRAFWSLASARRVLGYAPQDDSEVRYQEDIRRLLGDAGKPRAGKLGV